MATSLLEVEQRWQRDSANIENAEIIPFRQFVNIAVRQDEEATNKLMNSRVPIDADLLPTVHQLQARYSRLTAGKKFGIDQTPRSSSLWLAGPLQMFITPCT